MDKTLLLQGNAYWDPAKPLQLEESSGSLSAETMTVKSRSLSYVYDMIEVFLHS